ncbi:MAG: M42 family metallopeptidase [Promethearchaeota archaeon]
MINEKRVIERQKQLSEILGVSGREEKVVQFIIGEIEQYVDEYWIDANGNLMAVINGPKESPALLLDAHVDEIGFIITHVNENGFAYFMLIGGWDERILLGQSVIVEPENHRLYGVIGALPPHIVPESERKKPIPLEKLFIDFGFSSKEESEKMGVKIGTMGTVYSGFQELPGGHLKGKAFDDRSGCNILIQTLINIHDKEIPRNLCFSWSTQEEVGLRGARTSAYYLDKKYNIEMGIACENTTAADVPGVPPQKCPSILGKGPVITLVDSSMIASKMVIERLVKVAEKNSIPYQFKVPSRGGTDAGVMHLTRAGIPCGVVSVPGRYIHSPCTIIDKNDLIGAIKLVTCFLLDFS